MRCLWARITVELLSKWYLWNPHNSEITLRLLDNNNCYNLYRDETSNVHVTEEIFTLLTINNYNVVETGGVIDFTLILGNHVDSYLYGLLSVTNGWYRGSLTKLVLFWIYLGIELQSTYQRIIHCWIRVIVPRGSMRMKIIVKYKFNDGKRNQVETHSLSVIHILLYLSWEM